MNYSVKIQFQVSCLGLEAGKGVGWVKTNWKAMVVEKVQRTNGGHKKDAGG